MTVYESQKRWVAAHPRSIKASRKKYYEKNKVKLAEHKRQMRLLNLEYYQKMEKEKSARWRKKHPILVKRYARRRYLADYGLTEESFQELLLRQEGKCAICRIEMSHPNIDHSHDTGKTRGILCPSCNPMLGYVEKLMRRRPDILKDFARYLKKTKH